MARILFMAVLVMQVLLVSACAQSAHQTGRYVIDRVVPTGLRSQVDETVSFSDLRNAPSQYEGRIIMLSGVVLNAKRAEDKTEIEILQTPTKSGMPSADRSRSGGRFIAVDSGIVDPATVEKGSPVTVIGEVSGTMVKPMDEGHYTYPVVVVKQLVDWSQELTPRYAGYGPSPYYGGYYGPYGFSPYGYGGFYGYGPYGYAPYRYYPFGYGFLNGRSLPTPTPPPAESIPPEFKKQE
jgi:outer membrane lipoprotein